MGVSNKLYLQAIDQRKTPDELIIEAIEASETLTEAASRLKMSKQGLSYQMARRGIPSPFSREAQAQRILAED